MAHHQLGHQDVARQLFDETKDWMQQQEDITEGPALPNGQNWLEWAVYKSLQREADALIGSAL